MKKLLLFAAVASLATPAMASKARLNALGNAEHLVDTQTAFENPAHNALMADYVTFELGTSTPTAAAPSTSANAEGGFVRSAGDAKYMVYLGRKSDFTHSQRATGGFLTQENPIELQYAMKGDINWGAGLSYSNSDKKSTNQKQQAMGVRVGATTDMWEAYGIIGLGSTATGTTGGATALPLVADADAKYKGTTGFDVGAAYKMENLFFFGEFAQDGYKLETTAAGNAGLNNLEVSGNEIEVGVVDHNKIEGGQWFYGVSYKMTKSEAKGALAPERKSEANYLPFLLGVEYDMTTWATVRASVTQNVLIGSVKGTVGTTSNTDTVANNTTVGAGLAFRLNKFIIDAALQAATTGDVSLGNGTTSKFMTNAALTYTF